jgi:hypothetical protein
MNGASENFARHRREIEVLVDEYRTQCLWFMAADHYPTNDEEALVVLHQIEKQADLKGYVRAAELLEWLSPRSSARSAAS